ncbi:hypothetical protein B0H19DRAFT_1378728 [Mycena capillaripes]|nr:hypothetical protein B0H19DRAFT_1378728 [Mycena capillaripes]
MSAAAGDTTLPPELERLIFEIAALESPNCMPALVLVARRVQIWIEPLLYGALALTPSQAAQMLPTSSRPVSCKPPSFLRDHVRHLGLFGVSQAFSLRMLSMCSTAVNVAIFGAPNINISSILETMPLERISISLPMFFYRLRLIDTNYHHPLFRGITHLDVLNNPRRGWEAWSGLALLPRLTHLSFRPLKTHVPFSVCNGVLLHCRLLQVLALVYENQDVLPTAAAYPVLDTDPRLVTIPLAKGDLIEGWQMGARGGKDHWAAAEELVRVRSSTQSRSTANESLVVT